jgi:hypothetical protein
MNLEHESLFIKSISAVIRVFESATIEIPDLSDEVVVIQTEHEPFIIISYQAIDRNDTNALPLLIQKASILRPSVVYTKSIELRVHIKVDEGAVCGRRDNGIQHTNICSDGVVGTIIFATFDISGRRNVENIDVAVYRD